MHGPSEGQRKWQRCECCSKLVGTVIRADTCCRNVPKRRSTQWRNEPPQVRLAVKNQSEATSMSPEPRGENEKNLFHVFSIVLENVSGVLEMDSDAEMRCIPVIVGHVSIASHNVAFGCGKQHDHGAGILGCEAAHVRGAVSLTRSSRYVEMQNLSGKLRHNGVRAFRRRARVSQGVAVL